MMANSMWDGPPACRSGAGGAPPPPHYDSRGRLSHARVLRDGVEVLGDFAAVVGEGVVGRDEGVEQRAE